MVAGLFKDGEEVGVGGGVADGVLVDAGPGAAGDQGLKSLFGVGQVSVGGVPFVGEDQAAAGTEATGQLVREFPDFGRGRVIQHVRQQADVKRSFWKLAANVTVQELNFCMVTAPRTSSFNGVGGQAAGVIEKPRSRSLRFRKSSAQPMSSRSAMGHSGNVARIRVTWPL